MFGFLGSVSLPKKRLKIGKKRLFIRYETIYEGIMALKTKNVQIEKTAPASFPGLFTSARFSLVPDGGLQREQGSR